MTYIEGYDKSLAPLNLIFIHIPVPFEKGDIVTMYDRENEPHVLADFPHLWQKNANQYGREYEDYVAGKKGDGSDCLATTYSIPEYGRLLRDWYPHSLPTLKYFRGELKGQERFLRYLSQYIKENDGDVAWLIDVYDRFKKEAEFDDINRMFGGWWLPLSEEEFTG